MAQDPAFLMYYKQWLVSTAGWDADIRGWYINLLCHQADKPEGLPSDLESLADLAGVKISQFPRFKECWKRTLEAKFPVSENGLLTNLKQKKVIDDRNEYSDKQAKRGIIGYYIKISRSVFKVTDEQAASISIDLSKEDLLNKTKQEKDLCYKRTLVAHKIIVNVNVNINGLIGGAGGKKGFPAFKDEPDWWRIEVASFVSDDAWKKSFCKSKSIANDELTKRMNDFVSDLHLKSDFKDCPAIKKHFLHSYNKWVENGGLSKKEANLASKGFIEAPKNIDYENLDGAWSNQQ